MEITTGNRVDGYTCDRCGKYENDGYSGIGLCQINNYIYFACLECRTKLRAGEVWWNPVLEQLYTMAICKESCKGTEICNIRTAARCTSCRTTDPERDK